MAANLKAVSKEEVMAANLDESSKRSLLSQLFSGLVESMGQAEARRHLIRWLAQISDQKLSDEVRSLFVQTCENSLSTHAFQ